MEDLIKSISQVGFPIVIATYLLLRFEKEIAALRDSINALSIVISQLMQMQKEGQK